MPMNKPHLEFTRVDMASLGYLPEASAGIRQKILASDRLSRQYRKPPPAPAFRAGRLTPRRRFVHDTWEEVYLVSGYPSWANDPHCSRARIVQGADLCVGGPPACATARFKSAALRLFEIHYYDESSVPLLERRNAMRVSNSR